MSDEASIKSSLSIRIGNVLYQSQPVGFTADISTGEGPSPGLVLVGLTHTNIDLSKLTSPGFCRIQNFDDTNLVEIGIYSSVLDDFLPFMELLPKESYVFRLSRYIGQSQDPGTGTGTADTSVNYLSAKASVAPCKIIVEAFNT